MRAAGRRVKGARGGRTAGRARPAARTAGCACHHAGMPAVPARRPRLHYAWVVAGVTFLVLVMAAGFRSVPGVLFTPLGKDFGWSHALIGGAVSVNLIVYGLGAPFAAA